MANTRPHRLRSSGRALLALFAAALLASCDRETASTPTDAASRPAEVDKTLRIAVIPKGTTHEFWRTVEAGAARAATDLDVQMTFRGPEREDDRSQQISLIQNLIGSGRYDAIVLAPLDDRALVGPVKEAKAAGIPVVIFDSGLEPTLASPGTDFVSFVATDNKEGGRLAGEALAAAMGHSGKALLLRYAEGSASTLLREQGFIDAISAHPGISLVDPKRYAGATRATAQEAAENLLSAHPDIDGVFCSNESSTFGMLLALRSRGMAGRVKFVGFDSSDAFVDALRKGDMQAFVVQNPMRMGELALRAAVDHLRGLTVEPTIDTGVGVVTLDNVDASEIADILRPPLSASPATAPSPGTP